MKKNTVPTCTLQRTVCKGFKSPIAAHSGKAAWEQQSMTACGVEGCSPNCVSSGLGVMMSRRAWVADNVRHKFDTEIQCVFPLRDPGGTGLSVWVLAANSSCRVRI
jgi:hypothetical protein